MIITHKSEQNHDIMLIKRKLLHIYVIIHFLLSNRDHKVRQKCDVIFKLQKNSFFIFQFKRILIFCQFKVHSSMSRVQQSVCASDT